MVPLGIGGIELESCVKVENGRCVTPADTVKRLESALAPHYTLEYVGRQVSRRLHWGALFVDKPSLQCMGKGISATLCKASALAEAAERLSVAGSSDRFPGHVEAHERDVPNPLGIEDLLTHVADVTPEVLDQIRNSALTRHWVDARSLMTGDTLKVPLEYIHGISGTNGLAAGNRIEEAIVQATNEVFERRAAITVLKNRMVMPTIDVETIRHPVLRSQIDFVRSCNIDMHVKDLSFGGALPCVGVYYVNHDVPGDLQAHHFLKVGSSFDREEALMRAFTEFAQGRGLNWKATPLTKGFERVRCEGGETDLFLTSFKFGYVPYSDADFLRDGPVVPFDKGEALPDCLDDIDKARQIFRQLGKDFLVVDLTDPRIGFPVAQVIVPGYSDILPYHPKSSRVLLDGWSRSDPVGYYEAAEQEDSGDRRSSSSSSS